MTKSPSCLVFVRCISEDTIDRVLMTMSLESGTEYREVAHPLGSPGMLSWRVQGSKVAPSCTRWLQWDDGSWDSFRTPGERMHTRGRPAPARAALQFCPELPEISADMPQRAQFMLRSCPFSFSTDH